MAAYKRALRLQPNESSAHFNIAITYTKLNNDKKAVHHLQKSIINQPEYSSPYLVLGEVHRRNGHRAQELYMYI
ncbi:hypothetical protein AB833_21400 [Chromatiales bacterium (ex Bugula neritina AB1)]|nr:hypothetical protein AB833_21400 [Chromatiales bacterium (ex Bugula neritina AB1)]